MPLPQDVPVGSPDHPPLLDDSLPPLLAELVEVPLGGRPLLEDDAPVLEPSEPVVVLDPKP